MPAKEIKGMFSFTKGFQSSDECNNDTVALYKDEELTQVYNENLDLIEL